MNPEMIRYWQPGKGGWYHAQLLTRGRKWVRVRDLHFTLRKKDGIYRRRVRRLRVEYIREALWQ